VSPRQATRQIERSRAVHEHREQRDVIAPSTIASTNAVASRIASIERNRDTMSLRWRFEGRQRQAPQVREDARATARCGSRRHDRERADRRRLLSSTSSPKPNASSVKIRVVVTSVIDDPLQRQRLASENVSSP
jgi:hypothetical protein